MKLEVNKKRCPQNHRCPSVAICPVDALLQQHNEAPAVDEQKCILCGKCVDFCPLNALVLSEEE